MKNDITWQAQRDANEYRITQGDQWHAIVQFNGELTTEAQERILNKIITEANLGAAHSHGEPVAYMYSDEHGRTKIVLGKETAEHWCPPDESIQPLYTNPAQPANGVPEAMEWNQVTGRDGMKYTEGWNACRDAMMASQPPKREKKL